jgi:hypothetical protein
MDPALTFQYGLCMGQDGNEVTTTKREGPEMEVRTLGIDLADPSTPSGKYGY